MRESTVAATLAVDLIRYLERLGTPAAKVHAALHIDPAAFNQPNARMPGSVMERLWEYAVQTAHDPDMGLHAAEQYNPGALGILGYVLLSCHSADEALGRLADYAAILNDGLRVRVTREGDRTQCHFEIVANLDNYLARAPRHAIETMACGTVITLRRLTNTMIAPTEVAFQYPAPPVTTEHLRLFGPCVKFGQPENRIEFRSTDLTIALLSSNPVLLEMFDTQARQLLDQLGVLNQRGPISRKVLEVLARRITVRVPSLDEVATELAMSERTIQRELRGENTSFRQLIEDIRKEIALQHLAQPGASASEAAFLLGFSEPSAFTRAFRRWTGSAPTQFQSA